MPYSDGQTFDASNGAFLWNWPVCPTGTAANDFPSRTTDISVSSDTVFVPYLNVKFGMLLGAFDANRDLIHATAARVYARGRRGSYDLVGADF